MKTCGQCKHFAGNKEWTEKRQIAKEEYRGEFFICGYGKTNNKRLINVNDSICEMNDEFSVFNVVNI